MFLKEITFNDRLLDKLNFNFIEMLLYYNVLFLLVIIFIFFIELTIIIISPGVIIQGSVINFYQVT